MHPGLRAIADATLDTPWEGELWLVGGAVRDELLGRPLSSDFDLVLESDALELAHFLAEHHVAVAPPAVYPRFGTAMITCQGAKVELATARRESYAEPSRKPDVEIATLQEDAMRRDFTVNAIMRNLHTGEVMDPTGLGFSDLSARTLRTPLNPVKTFFDDPLRMLRAVRFRWKLGFTPAHGLWDAIISEHERLEIVSEERIRDELSLMLSLPDADGCLQDMLDLRLLEQFGEELVRMVGVEQGSFHHLDVWEHTLLVVRNIGSSDHVLSLAALLHDVGKPTTRTIDEHGRTRFFSHEAVGAEIAHEFLRRLRFSSEVIDVVVLLVKNHMRMHSGQAITPSAARRLIRDLGNQLDRLIALVRADRSAMRPGVEVGDLDQAIKSIESARIETPRERLEAPISGEEIMELLGIGEGPLIGQCKAHLLELVLEGELLPGDREAALRLAREWAAGNLGQ